MRIILAAVVSSFLFFGGCISPKTWNGDVIECPVKLLESVDKKLEELCQPKPLSTPP
jgi:outer membrane murein-binding lipoprotein Lpp